MILLIDNYDSFTYNLYQYLRELGAVVEVVRNDEATVEDIDVMAPDRIVISPGPGTPSDAGISVPVVRHFAGKTPVLGVCLGHQSIGEAFGGVVAGAGEILHGKTSQIKHGGEGVFPAESDSGVIMGVRHRRYPIEGVQFHPESILTAVGKDILRNFLEG